LLKLILPKASVIHALSGALKRKRAAHVSELPLFFCLDALVEAARSRVKSIGFDP
jgi:hypothetical protein